MSIKGLHTPSNLQSSGGDLKVLADIIAVKHGIDVGEVDFLVGELTTLLQDWTQGNQHISLFSDSNKFLSEENCPCFFSM